jgi:hypothetical protein
MLIRKKKDKLYLNKKNISIKTSAIELYNELEKYSIKREKFRGKKIIEKKIKLN